MWRWQVGSSGSGSGGDGGNGSCKGGTLVVAIPLCHQPHLLVHLTEVQREEVKKGVKKG